MNATTRATFDELRGRFVKANPGRDPLTPPAQGLYHPSKEHDSCGVGFVADMKNRKSHDILEKGLQILINLDHRGAVGADPSLGDGCGVLTQIPHAFFASECAKLGFDLPAQGHYAIGQFFMPRRSEARKQVQAIVEEVVAAEGLNLLGWREVPVDNSALGERVKAVEPVMQQIFIGRPADLATEDDFERRL
jgi:glutamate synthase (NADPH/NADH) large chain